MQISIHAPHAGRDGQGGENNVISIHAPLAGCDAGAMWRRADDGYFNPRTPRGVRLVLLMSDNGTPEISIHALLAGRDDYN